MKFLDKNTALKLLGQELINHSVVISDPNLTDCPMVFVSREFSIQTGYSEKESLGRNCRFLQGPETDPNDIDQIRVAIKLKKKLLLTY